jgi:hypothetical protein
MTTGTSTEFSQEFLASATTGTTTTVLLVLLASTSWLPGTQYTVSLLVLVHTPPRMLVQYKYYCSLVHVLY